jgi:dipeptidyl aminopeptidase/acylaminoacyl peptidase
MAFVDVAGRITPWEGEERGVDSGPEISPDGRRFACSIANARGIDEIVVSDIDRPGYRRIGTDPNADCTFAQWSPDGRQLAYVRRGRDGRDGVYVQNADGGEAKRVYVPRSDEERATPHSWLPDGSALLLAIEAQGGTSITLLSLAGDPADAMRARALVSSATRVDWPRISPEGKRVAYLSDESGQVQVYVAELRSDRTLGHPVQVRTAEGYTPRWSRDGRSLFLRDERGHLMNVAVGAAPELTLSTPEDVFDLDALDIAMWAVLPDGRFFVGLKNEDEGPITKLNLVLGWTEELERRLREAH